MEIARANICLTAVRVGLAFGIGKSVNRLGQTHVRGRSILARPLASLRRVLSQNVETGLQKVRDVGTGDDPVVIRLLRASGENTDTFPREGTIAASHLSLLVFDNFNRVIGALMAGVPIAEAVPPLPGDIESWTSGLETIPFRLFFHLF